MTTLIMGGKISRKLPSEALQLYTNLSFNRGYLMPTVATLLKPASGYDKLSNSTNVDKLVCNKLLVNSTEVPITQKTATILIAHLHALKAKCPFPLFNRTL